MLTFMEYHERRGGCTAYCKDGVHSAVCWQAKPVDHEFATSLLRHFADRDRLKVVDVKPAPEAKSDGTGYGSDHFGHGSFGPVSRVGQDAYLVMVEVAE